MRWFLFSNGYLMRVGTDEAVCTMLDVAAGRLAKKGLAEWIEKNAVAKP